MKYIMKYKIYNVFGTPGWFCGNKKIQYQKSNTKRYAKWLLAMAADAERDKFLIRKSWCGSFLAGYNSSSFLSSTATTAESGTLLVQRSGIIKSKWKTKLKSAKRQTHISISSFIKEEILYYFLYLFHNSLFFHSTLFDYFILLIISPILPVLSIFSLTSLVEIYIFLKNFFLIYPQTFSLHLYFH